MLPVELSIKDFAHSVFMDLESEEWGLLLSGLGVLPGSQKSHPYAVNNCHFLAAQHLAPSYLIGI